MGDIWRSQQAAGYWKGTIENVGLRVGYAEFGNDVRAYAAYVHADEANIREGGYEGWVAYEGHGERKQVKQAWMWAYRTDIGNGFTAGGKDKILEWVDASQFKTITEFDKHVKRNRGTGWQFPKIYLFEDEPPQMWYESLRKWRVPYINLWEYNMIEDPTPVDPSPDPEPVPVLKQLPPLGGISVSAQYPWIPQGTYWKKRIRRMDKKLDYIIAALYALNKRTQGF